MKIKSSTRETIVKALIDDIESIAGAKTVVRSFPTNKALEAFSWSQFPVIAVVAGMPTPEEKLSSRSQGIPDLYRSSLIVSLFMYFHDTGSKVDENMSEWLNKIWSKVLADPTRGGEAFSTEVRPDPSVEYFDPYVAFKVDVVIKYHRTTGEI